MAITRAKKEEILKVLTDGISESGSVGIINTFALTAEEVEKLRKDLRSVGASMVVAKKTLIKLAFKNTVSVEIPNEQLPSQIALIFSKEDPIAGLGTTNTLRKEFNTKELIKIDFTGVFMDGKLLDLESSKKIAGLPSRETLLAKLLGSMMSPLSGLARFFDGTKQKLEETSGKTVADLIEEKKTEEKTKEPKKEEAPAEKKEEEKTEEK